jgi:hypothetical protein
MSAHNGDKARFQKNRKRSVVRRAKIRELAAGTSEAGAAQAQASKRRIKPPLVKA